MVATWVWHNYESLFRDAFAKRRPVAKDNTFIGVLQAIIGGCLRNLADHSTTARVAKKATLSSVDIADVIGIAAPALNQSWAVDSVTVCLVK
jgi:hypothetical protein